MNHKTGKTIWFTGLSGSGKSTLSCRVKSILERRNVNVVLLDGDALRSGLNRDLGFSAEDRAENIRRAGETAKILTDAGHTVIAAFITPLETLRKAVRNLFEPGCYAEIYLDCSLSVCESRDPKGLYKRAREGKIPNFTGISSPFEIPLAPDLLVNTDKVSPETSLDLILRFLEDRFHDLRPGHRPASPKPLKKKGRVAVIGLDGVPSSLVFGRFMGKLPTLNLLMKHGTWGPLKSTDPPITIPAWTCMTTGKDPGELGIYGFRNRAAFDYSQLVTADACSVSAPRVWDRIEESGRSSILIGIPQTFPVREHRGITIAGFPASRSSNGFSHPPELAEQLDGMADGQYVEDILNFRNRPLSELAQELRQMVDGRFSVAGKLLLTNPWDFMMMVEIAPDRAHHMFWRFFDPEHPGFEANSEYAEVIPDFYAHLDTRISSLLSLMDDETTVMIVSDHGAMPCHGGVCVNEWLIRHGYLCLKRKVEKVSRLEPSMIDWSRTAAWSEGGYYGRIFINVKGREPQGIVELEHYEAFRDELAKKLEEIRTTGGELIRNKVYRPGDLYLDQQNIPPDLIVYFDGLKRRALSTIGTSAILVKGDGYSLDDCNHDPLGIFICTKLSDLRSGRVVDKTVEGLSYKDITPRILSFYDDKTISEDTAPSFFCQGALVFEPAGVNDPDESVAPGVSGTKICQERGFSSEEEEIVRKRLEELGYI